MSTVDKSIAQAWQYHRVGNLQEAERRYREILRVAPTHPDAWYLLGSACHVLGNLSEAVDCYKEALRLKPTYVEALSNLGVAYKVQGRVADAIASYHEALRLKPSFPDAYNNLGLALEEQGNFEEAVANFNQALHLKPDFPEAHYNLGKALQQQGKTEEAIASYHRTLQLQPNYPDAFNNLAVALTVQGKLDEAAMYLQRALAANPQHADAHNNLGNVLKEQGRLDEAAYHYDQAFKCRPGFAGAHSNLLVCWNYDPTSDPDALFVEHRRWADLHARVTPATVHPNDRNIDRRLRVGYVSPDFYLHAAAHFLEPIFQHHDPNQVEIFCYAEVFASDAVTDRFRSRADVWRSTVGLSDAEIVEQVCADRIDILVDLAGHTANSRLGVFASKPAPVQITYLGYPNTTGLKAIDYRLTDAVADPVGEPVRHTEELVRMPHAFCYAVLENAPETVPPPACDSGRVTFGSLHNLAKLNGQVLDLWCAILRAVPSSRLLVFRHTLQGSALQYFRGQLTQRGIGPDRFELCNTLGASPNYLNVYPSVDIALDAFPWNGHTTACEALWMGVPVITLYGQRYAGRMAASALTALGLTELIARSAEDYVAIAADWAADVDRLVRLRAGLRERMRTSALCDAAAFTRRLEETYRSLWRRWCARQDGPENSPAP
jgi:predicted O-linked N-acetylglucosamine transferase (SPINDLY family)